MIPPLTNQQVYSILKDPDHIKSQKKPVEKKFWLKKTSLEHLLSPIAELKMQGRSTLTIKLEILNFSRLGHQWSRSNKNTKTTKFPSQLTTVCTSQN